MSNAGFEPSCGQRAASPAVAAPVTLTAEEAVRRAAALVPRLAERASRCEELGRVPDETIAELHETGLLRMMQPARFGGAELSVESVFDVCVELARGCASTAWVFSNLVIHSWNIGQFALAAQEDVWATDPTALAATGLAFPCGKARAVPGGYRLTGRWPFASGVDASTWMLVGALVPRDGAAPERRMFLVPAADFRNTGNWRAYGLAGSGSHDVLIDDAFVPEHRSLAADVWASGNVPGADVNTAPLFRLPPYAAFSFLLGVVPYGAARAALDDFLTSARQRAALYSGARLAEHVPVQLRLAEAASCVDFAELELREEMRRLAAIVEAGQQPSLEEKIRWRRNVAFGVQLCVRAVDTLMTASGGNGVVLGSALQRRFRDVHAAASHIAMTWDVQATFYARDALGLPNEGLVL